MSISRVLRAVKYFLQLKDFRAAWILSSYGRLPVEMLTCSSGAIRLKANPDADLSIPENRFIIQGLPLIQDLFNVGFEIEAIDAGNVRIKGGGTSILIKTWEEIFISHEIYYNLEYNFRLGEMVRVVDVGGNTGIASLYFSSLPEVSSVVAYELFEDTALRFKENLALNPHLSEKIELIEMGLADSDGELELDYCPDVKGSVGLFGVADHAVGGNSRMKVEKRKVKVVNAAKVFNALLVSAPKMPLVAKIDCEGAEYQIIDCLAEAGLLSKIDAFLIEWHGKGHDPISAKLIAAGHGVWLRSHPGSDHGMIYSSLRRKLD